MIFKGSKGLVMRHYGKILFLKFSIVLLGLLLSTVQAAPKKHLLVEHTATWCPYCGIYLQPFNDYLEENSDDVIGVAVHGSDDLTFDASNQIISVFPPDGYPSMWQNYDVRYHPGNVESRMRTLLGATSEVAVDMRFNWDESTRSIRGNIELVWDDNATYERDLVVEVLVLHDSIPTSEFSQNMNSGTQPDFHRHILIDAAFGGTGQNSFFLNRTAQAGDSVVIPFSINLQESYGSINMNFEHISLVAYVGLEPLAENGTVLNSHKVGLTQGRPLDPAPFLSLNDFRIVNEEGEQLESLSSSIQGYFEWTLENSGDLAAQNLQISSDPQGDIPRINLSGVVIDEIPSGETRLLRVPFETGDFFEAGAYDLAVSISGDDLNWQTIQQVVSGLYIWNQDDSLSTCNQLILDAGGMGPYASNTDLNLVLRPDTENAQLQVEILEFSTESNYDFLFADLNGDGNYDNTTERWSGSNISEWQLNETSEQELRLQFTSDYSVVSSGFALKVSCSGIPVAGKMHTNAQQWGYNQNGRLLNLTGYTSNENIRIELYNSRAQLVDIQTGIQVQLPENSGVYFLKIHNGKNISTLQVLNY
jgi:hypothetical protein